MTKSFKAVLRDKHVKAILVNVFAGINRCDWVAKGVVDAVRELEIKIPIVVRLAGTKVEEGRRIIDDSGLTMISADPERSASHARSRSSGQQFTTRSAGIPARRACATAVSAYESCAVVCASLSSAKRHCASRARVANV